MKCVGIGAILLMFLAGPAAFAGNVGFQQLSISDGTDPPMTIGIWYPTDAPESPSPLGVFTQTVAVGAPLRGNSLSLVVISHGTGGSFAFHYDTAVALARTGYIAAALSHTGDTTDDRSWAFQSWRRPPQLRHLIDYMLQEWPEHGRVDAARVGAFGFSAGGFTVLATAGGVPDMIRIVPHCHQHPDYFDCQNFNPLTYTPPPASVWFRDSRIKAAVIAAPARGYSFDAKGLMEVRIPIQLWRADEDEVLPPPEYADLVRDALPRSPEFHEVPNAGHYDFLAPCPALLARAAPQICHARLGFDREAFHRSFNAAVVAFFQRTLGVRMNDH
jgi:predicted dienelactone hydrolase